MNERPCINVKLIYCNFGWALRKINIYPYATTYQYVEIVVNLIVTN